jgi:hypothetical protein
MKTMSHGTVSTDPDLAALSAATGYSQTLHDEALLSFDLTPTVSGPLAFQYVFGSEEYPFFAPSPGRECVKGLEHFICSAAAHVTHGVQCLERTLNRLQGSKAAQLNSDRSSSSSSCEHCSWLQQLQATRIVRGATQHPDAGARLYCTLPVCACWCCCCCWRMFACTGNPTQPNSNDIFGFFIWPSSGFPTNVAILPNSTTPVSIATVNALYNAYYVSNDFYSPPVPAIATELNGFTSLLKTNDYQVSAGTTYHVKLAIADGADDKWDTVVWIRAGSVRFNIKDCVGIWVPHTWGPSQGVCTGGCGGGPGLLPEAYFISVAAANGEWPCWTVQQNFACQCGCTLVLYIDTACGFCAETMATAVVAKTSQQLPSSMHDTCALIQCMLGCIAGGNECPTVNGTTRLSTPCNNDNPCPINCTASWVENGNCTGQCSGGSGFTPKVGDRPEAGP